MSAKRKRRNTKKSSKPDDPILLNYPEAFKAADRPRVTQFVVADSLQPDLAIDSGTQLKLMAVVAIMDGIGKLLIDLPKEKFDQPVTYHKLPQEAIDWLEKVNIPARKITPFATYCYRELFASKNNCLVEAGIIEKFFSHFIDCLLTETQIIIAKQYYHDLGLYQPRTDIPALYNMLPPEFRKGALNSIKVDELRGRIFLEYCAVMIRAQWDKLVSLSCLVFGLKQNWDSIFDGIKLLDQKIGKSEGLHPACKYYAKVFLDIANERLNANGWLRNFRDSLLHGVGQHSLGVAPHKTSSLTTSELWNMVSEEHNWLREGMMAILIAFISKNAVAAGNDNASD